MTKNESTKRHHYHYESINDNKVIYLCPEVKIEMYIFMYITYSCLKVKIKMPQVTVEMSTNKPFSDIFWQLVDRKVRDDFRLHTTINQCQALDTAHTVTS